MNSSTRGRHVVVIGGGFGGLWATRALARAPVRVTLIDRNNHHVFHPLLYQVAAASLPATDIAAPLRHIVRDQPNVTVWMDEVSSIDPSRRLVRTARRSVGYDYLVVASGSRCTYFGHDQWSAYAPPLKSISDALVIRQYVLAAFERAEVEPDPTRRTAYLTFVIVGGGATGVELAGTLAEMAVHTLPHEFRVAHPRDARIHLVELGPRILPALPPSLSARATAELVRMGVLVHTGRAVTDIDAHGVSLDKARIEAHTVLWAAGVSASPLARQLGAECDRGGRVRVMEDLSVPGHPEVFAIGDIAHVESAGQRVPGVAPAAKQMGTYVARAIRARIASRTMAPFRYHDLGSLAAINHTNAVVSLRRLRFSGRSGRLFWLCAHIFFLIGFRNRIAVMWNWAWSYFNWQRSARIMTERGAPPGQVGPVDDGARRMRSTSSAATDASPRENYSAPTGPVRTRASQGGDGWTRAPELHTGPRRRSATGRVRRSNWSSI